MELFNIFLLIILRCHMSILDKLAKIEALIEKASTEGERHAAILAKDRIFSSLEKYQTQIPIEYKLTLKSYWKKRLFVALCSRRGLQTYRYYRQKHTTTNVKVSKVIMDQELWPEFLRFAKILEELVEDIMKDLMKKIWQGKEKETVITGEIDF